VSSTQPGERRGLPVRMKMRHDAHYVDELTTRDTESVGQMVPLNDIEADPNQPRTAFGDLAELVESIRSKGILEPILVRLNPDEEPRFRIISGERRFRAAREAGLESVPVIEMSVDDDEALEIGLIENLQRKDLTAFEEAEAYRSLGDLYGYTHEKIASAMGKSRTVITESLSLLSIPEDIRAMAESLGVRSKSLLLEVGKLGSEDEMRQVVQQASEHRLTRDDLRQRTRQPAKGKPKDSQQPKPFTFKFKAPDESYNLSLSFQRDTVDPEDLIDALEQTLFELRRSQRRQPRI
jgi:ParB family chromosome partitioning protein